MCRQTFNQHTCTHLTHGSLTTCATPSATGHQRTSSIISCPYPCPSCHAGRLPSISNPPSYRPASVPSSIPPPAYSSLPPTVIYTIPQHAPPQVQQVVYPEYHYPAYTIIQPPPIVQAPQSYPWTPVIYYPTGSYFPATFQTPPPFPPFPPGKVPSWYPRETRHELIRGVLTPVEHFAAPSTTPPQSGRGYNTIHGYDNGPLPPGVGSGPSISARGWNPVHGHDHGPLPHGVGHSVEANLLRGLSHVAMPTGGGGSGSVNGGESRNGGDGASEIGSEVVEVGSRAGGSEAGEGSRRVSFRDPLIAPGSESSRFSSEERAIEAGAEQGGNAAAGTQQAQGGGTWSLAPVPPSEASISAPSSLPSGTLARENDSGISRENGGRITRSQKGS